MNVKCAGVQRTWGWTNQRPGHVISSDQSESRCPLSAWGVNTILDRCTICVLSHCLVLITLILIVLSKQRQQSELDRDKNRNKFYAFITFKSPFPSSINISVKHNYKNENNNQFNTLIKLIRSSYKAVFKMVSMIFCGPTLPLSVPLAWTNEHPAIMRRDNWYLWCG